MRYVTVINGHEHIIEIIDEHHVSVDDAMYEVDFTPVGDHSVCSLLINNESFDAHVYQDEGIWHVFFHGTQYIAEVEDEREKRLRAAASSGITAKEEYHLRAPMPGMVVAIPVCEGQQVEKNDILLILESMKMQNELRSPRAGTVARLRVQPGDRVEQKEALLSVI